VRAGNAAAKTRGAGALARDRQRSFRVEREEVPQSAHARQRHSVSGHQNESGVVVRFVSLGHACGQRRTQVCQGEPGPRP
jgi:hypothetical protein